MNRIVFGYIISCIFISNILYGQIRIEVLPPFINQESNAPSGGPSPRKPGLGLGKDRILLKSGDYIEGVVSGYRDGTYIVKIGNIVKNLNEEEILEINGASLSKNRQTNMQSNNNIRLEKIPIRSIPGVSFNRDDQTHFKCCSNGILYQRGPNSFFVLARDGGTFRFIKASLDNIFQYFFGEVAILDASSFVTTVNPLTEIIVNHYEKPIVNSSPAALIKTVPIKLSGNPGRTIFPLTYSAKKLSVLARGNSSTQPLEPIESVYSLDLQTGKIDGPIGQCKIPNSLRGIRFPQLTPLMNTHRNSHNKLSGLFSRNKLNSFIFYMSEYENETMDTGYLYHCNKISDAQYEITEKSLNVDRIDETSGERYKFVFTCLSGSHARQYLELAFVKTRVSLDSITGGKTFHVKITFVREDDLSTREAVFSFPIEPEDGNYGSNDFYNCSLEDYNGDGEDDLLIWPRVDMSTAKDYSGIVVYFQHS